MLTGLHHTYVTYLSGRLDEIRPLPTSIPTLATYFNQSGYRTLGVTDSGFMDPAYGWDRDFDTFIESRKGFGDKLQVNGEERWVKKFNWEFASNWLKENSNGDPFFLFLHSYNPHTPYSSVGYEHFWYDEEAAERFDPDISRRIGGKPGKKFIEHLNRVYDRNLRRTDDQLMLFFNTLRDLDLLDNTLIVITSDHGEYLGEHNLYADHGKLWNASLRVPLIIINGEDLDNSLTDSRISLLNISPTILEMAGLVVPDYLDGKALSNEVMQTDNTLFAANDSKIIALYKNDYKYMLTSEEELLFDLQNDPDEQNPLTDSTELVEQLKHELMVHFAQQIPGWNIYLPNPDNQRLRLTIADLAPEELYYRQNELMKYKTSTVSINNISAEIDQGPLLFLFEMKNRSDVEIKIDFYDESSNSWRAYGDQLRFNASALPMEFPLILPEDSYPNIALADLLPDLQSIPVHIWYTSKPFNSEGSVNQLELSNEDIENLENLGYLQ
jgi:arylsulfatase A-like enzyme